MGSDYTVNVPVLSPLDLVFTSLDVDFFWCAPERRVSSSPTPPPWLKVSGCGSGSCEPGNKGPPRMVSVERSPVDSHLLSSPHLAFFQRSYSSLQQWAVSTFS